MIKANCRQKFTANDFKFIVDTLAKSSKEKPYLSQLLADEEVRDELLDHRVLLDAILDGKSPTNISPHLYFYVLTRKALLDFGIEEREIADYIASMLSEFCSMRSAYSISYHDDQVYYYIVDLLLDLVEASSREAFLLRSHIGNYSLFLTGIFPDYIYTRSVYGRSAPGFEYFEQIGSVNYRLASHHSIAHKYGLTEIFSEMALRFRPIRLALNHLSDDFITLNQGEPSLDKILRSIFHGPKKDKKF
ncbi:MAG: hypothetical protein ONB05_03245 [candidate division KSB1 bacterium]|nr:hypothetical protein [candidate division KSB1 bacterium]